MTMSTRLRPKIVLGFAVLVPALGAGCLVDLGKEAPQASEAVKSAYPDAELVKATREDEGGLKAYEASLKQGDRRIELEVTEDGRILEVESEVPMSEVSPGAGEAIRKLV